MGDSCDGLRPRGSGILVVDGRAVRRLVPLSASGRASVRGNMNSDSRFRTGRRTIAPVLLAVAAIACNPWDRVEVGKPRLIPIPSEVNVAVGRSHDVGVVACQPSFNPLNAVVQAFIHAMMAAMGHIDVILGAPGAVIDGCESQAIEPGSGRTEWTSGSFPVAPKAGVTRHDAIAFTITASAPGSGTLRIVARVGDDEVDAEIRVNAMNVDRLGAPVCPTSNVVAVGAQLGYCPELYAGTVRLSGYGAPAPIDATNLATVAAPDGCAYFVAPATPTLAWLTSPVDPDFVRSLEVVDAAAVDGILLKPAISGMFPTERRKIVTEASVGGQPFCWGEPAREVSIETPDVCTTVASADPIYREFSVEALRPGTCRLAVGMAGQAKLATLEVEVLPAFAEMDASALGSVTHLDLWGTATELFSAGWEPGEAASSYRRVVARHDGASWTKIGGAVAGGAGVLRAIWGSGPSDIVAVGNDGARGVIVQFDGNAWVESDVSSAPLTTVWGSDAANVYAAGAGGTVLRRANGVWSAVDVGAGVAGGATWEAVGGTGPADVYVVGGWSYGAGRIAHFDGVSWHLDAQEALGDKMAGTCTAVWAFGPDDVQVACGYGFHFDGAGWVSGGLPGVEFWGTSSTIGHYAIGSSRSLGYMRGESSWLVLPAISQVESIWGRSATDVYVAAGRPTATRIYRLAP